MRSHLLAIACTFSISVSALAQMPASTPPVQAGASALIPVSLQEVLARAAVGSPLLRAKQAQAASVEGLNADAQALLFNNPQIALDGARRNAPQAAGGNERFGEWGAGLSQTFETGGQRGFRREYASASLEALRLEIADVRRQVRSEVTAKFYAVLALQQRMELESQALALFEDAAAAVQKRRNAGEDTKLDANVAMVEAERARNQLAEVRERLNDARADLAAQIQSPEGSFPEAIGELTPQPVAYSLADLLSAIDRQPRIAALLARERSANARLNLEKASVSPDVTVGLNVGREGPGTARERVTTISVTVPLPLFRRNATGIGQASSDATQALIDRERGRRDAQAAVVSLWARMLSQEQRIRRLQQSVLPALADNLSLSVRSRQAGQIGLLELLLVNRQALDARRDMTAALTEYHSTRAALELAAGWPNE